MNSNSDLLVLHGVGVHPIDILSIAGGTANDHELKLLAVGVLLLHNRHEFCYPEVTGDHLDLMTVDLVRHSTLWSQVHALHVLSVLQNIGDQVPPEQSVDHVLSLLDVIRTELNNGHSSSAILKDMGKLVSEC